MDFGNKGMEAITFKGEDHLSQPTASDLTSRVPSSSRTEKNLSSLYQGWLDSMSGSSSKSFLELKIYIFFKAFSHVLIIKDVTKLSQTAMSFVVPPYTYKNTS